MKTASWDFLKHEIRERVPIVEAGERCGLDIRRRSGGQAFAICPWHSEKSGSLSLNNSNKGYHCFGCGASGDVFTMWMKVHGCTFPQAVRSLAALAGVALPDDGAGGVRSPNSWPVKAVRPPDRFAVSKKPEFRRIPAAVLERWEEGRRPGPRTDDWLCKLAAKRGFLAQSLGWLLGEGKISFPWLPWCMPGEPRAQRGVAFLIEGTRGRVGYHQLWHRDGKKQWVFVPYRIDEERARNEFQASMVGGESLRPLPFVLGDPGARRWYILEGQWDAIACWECLGRPAARDAFFVGLRGAQSGEVFLSEYLHHIKQMPDVWVIPDNDAAGSALLDGGRARAALWRQLEARGCGVSLVRVPAKDFNDWYRLAGAGARAGFRDKMGVK